MFFFKGRLNIQIKIIVIKNRLKKMFKFVFYMIVWKTKLSGVWFLRLDSGREPNFSVSESDMYTVHARSEICPCVPPCTRHALPYFIILTFYLSLVFFYCAKYTILIITFNLTNYILCTINTKCASYWWGCSQLSVSPHSLLLSYQPTRRAGSY